MGDYKVGLVSEYEIINSNDSINLLVNLKDIKKLTTSRTNWNKANLNNGLIWIGGGGSYLINDQYFILVKRSHDAPSNPGKLTILSGLSDDCEEWKNPSLIKRELFEEVILLDHNKKLFFWPDIEKSSETIIKNSLKNTPYEHYTGSPIAGQWLNNIAKDKITVKDNDSIIQSMGLIHLNENHINFLFCCQITLPTNFAQIIQFIDSEFLTINGEKKFLHREVYFYDLNNEIILNTNLNKENSAELTSHAEFLIQKLIQERRKND